MLTLQEKSPRREVERRAAGRTVINRRARLYFEGDGSGHACFVHDVTNHGAGIRVHGLDIVPSGFGVSFDNFRTMRKCRLIWRGSDFVGVAFES
jgi:hypothetical protein